MSYLATYTEPNAEPATLCEHLTLSDARIACGAHLSEVWHKSRGSEGLLDPSHAYDRGQFAHWSGISRIYVTTPNGEWAHYDIAELTR